MQMMDIFNTFCEQTHANNLAICIFICFGSNGIYPWCQIFTVLILGGRLAYLAELQSLKLAKDSERTKSKMFIFA